MQMRLRCEQKTKLPNSLRLSRFTVLSGGPSLGSNASHVGKTWRPVNES
jgi:hypothetical protein